MSNLLHAIENAIEKGDLERVKRLVAEGLNVKVAVHGFTPYLWAATYGHTEIMKWLLTEGGSSLAEKNADGMTALLIVARNGNFPAMRYLLEDQGVSVRETDNRGRTVWNVLQPRCRDSSDTEVSALLKVIVMLGDAPADFFNGIFPSQAEICTRGRQFRAQLPSYLEQQRAVVVAHCPLPGVLQRCKLQSLVAEYAATTPEDMWADGLRVQAPGVKRRRTEAESKEAEKKAEKRRETRRRNAEAKEKAKGQDTPTLRRSLRARIERG
jgi:hypothetical protein